MNHLMYNAKLNILGVKLPEWEFVLTLREIPANCLGRRHTAFVSYVYDCDADWIMIDQVSL